MNPFRKLVVVLALVTLATLASTSTAFTSTTVFYQADAAGVCGCCPATCGGGTLIGCFNTINMPPNAVTCVYDTVGSCVSCINKAPVADTDVATGASR